MVPHLSEHHPRHRLHEKKDKVKAWTKIQDPHKSVSEPISIAHPQDPRAIESAQAANSTAQFAMNFRTPTCDDLDAPHPHELKKSNPKKKSSIWFCCS